MMNIFKHTKQQFGLCEWHVLPARDSSIKSLAALCILVLLFSGFASRASAQCFPEEIQKLTAFDADLGDHFGTTVVILGDLVIVGANHANVDPFSAGAAYIYRKDPITNRLLLEQKISSDDGSSWDEFSLSVAINHLDPNLIIVGAWADDDADDCCDCSQCQSGSAYIFRYNPVSQLWEQEQKLTASDADSQDRFGWAVSIWGDVAIIGARLDEDSHQGSGSAYVFRYDPDSGIWNEQQKIIPPDPGTFGTSISLEGDVVLIGASADQEFGLASGAAYIYRMDTDTQIWQLQQKLLPNDPVEGAAFGWSVSLDGDTASIAAPGADGNTIISGAAYVFTYDGQQWTQQQKLFASDGEPLDEFGRAVSLANGIAVVSASLDDVGEDTLGSAYIFTFDSKQWNETAKLYASDAQAGDLFGTHASTDGEHVIVGANFSDDACPPGENCESGSAYIFGGLGDCNANGVIDICDIADGNAIDINNNGIPDECEPPECPWDLDGSGSVGASDLITLFAQWGTSGSADFDGSGAVGTSDLLILFANWGPC